MKGVLRGGALVLALCLVLPVALAAEDAPPDDFEIKPWVHIFSHYEYNISGYEDYDERYDENDHNKFDQTRIWFGLDTVLTKHWSSRGALAASRVKDADGDNTGILEVWVLYGFFRYQPFSYFGVDFGMVRSAYVPHVYKYWNHRYIMQPVLYNYRFSRSLYGGMGSGVSGNFPGGFGGYRVVFMNGEGKKNQEANAGKAVEARLHIVPFPMLEAAKGLGIMAYYRFDKVEPDAVEESFTVYDLLLSYKLKLDEGMGFSVSGEFAQRTKAFGDPDIDPIVSQVYSVWADFWIQKKYGVIVRHDWYDPNTQNDKDKEDGGYQDEKTTLVAGLWYEPIKQIRVSPNYRRISYTAEIEDDKGKDVGKQPDQYLYFNTQVKFK